MEALKNTSMMLVLAAVFYGAYQMFVSDPSSLQKPLAETSQDQVVYSGEEGVGPGTAASVPPGLERRYNETTSPQTGERGAPFPSQDPNASRYDQGFAQSPPSSPPKQQPWGGFPSDPGLLDQERMNPPNGGSANPALPGGIPPLQPPQNPTQGLNNQNPVAGPSVDQIPGREPAGSFPPLGGPRENDVVDRIPNEIPSSPNGVGLVGNTSPESQRNLMPIQPAVPSPRDPRIDQLAREMQQASAEIMAGNPTAALKRLSPWSNQSLGESEQRQLQDWLNRLAGEVVWSPQHTLAQPYTIQQGDTLASVANRFQVTPKLLALINFQGQDVSPQAPLQPGAQLKVIPGPFNAVADTRSGKMTVYLGKLFTGQFDFRTGDSAPYETTSGTITHVSEAGIPARDGDNVIPALGPGNPFGRHCLIVGDQVVLHSPGEGVDSSCLEFRDEDMQNLQAILGPGSEVSVLR